MVSFSDERNTYIEIVIAFPGFIFARLQLLFCVLSPAPLTPYPVVGLNTLLIFPDKEASTLDMPAGSSLPRHTP